MVEKERGDAPKEHLFYVESFTTVGRTMGAVVDLVEAIDATQLADVMAFVKSGLKTAPAGLDEQQRNAVRALYDAGQRSMKRREIEGAADLAGFTFLSAPTPKEAMIRATALCDAATRHAVDGVLGFSKLGKA